jgi:hypothetical protein
LGTFPKSIKGQGLEDKVMISTRAKRFAECVAASAKKRIEERRGSNEWLQDSVIFDHSLRISTDKKSVIVRLFSELMKGQHVYKQQQKLLDFEILLSNLLFNRRKPVAISLNRNEWKYSRYTRASYFVIKIIELFQNKRLLYIKKGYHTKEQPRKTRIWATEMLLSYFPKSPDEVIYDPVELVELHDETGALKAYKDTDETRRIRSILTKANSVNRAAVIKYHKYPLATHLIAIFKGKFTLYGRLHTKGHRHYQGFSGDERKEITINGDPVVELDFSGLHPHLLYAAEGKQYFGDPYSAVESAPGARPFLKQILLCMLNAKDEIAAERAANYWLYHNRTERRELKIIGITRARPLIEAFKEVHKRIAGYFCKGKETGLQIMNLDSKIALDVVNHFAKQNKPILSIHDSFLVQRQSRDELFQTMQQAYKKWTKGFRCPIK